MKRQTGTVVLVLLVLIAGCATRRQHDEPGPARHADVTVAPWTSRPAPAAILTSPRYRIYTTLSDGPRRDAIPQVLEAAYERYRSLAPAQPVDDRPMHGYVFADRREFEAFTSRRTGSDAKMYLSIPRGGYTIDDWFAAYSDTDAALFSATAHEGWHQYAARHFRGRLPPFLDEGIACLFENVRIERDGLPRWDGWENPMRTHALRVASRQGKLWPLAELVTLHAGEIVSLHKVQVDAFYAQNWAFARFLIEAEGGRYRPALRRLLADTAAGTTFDPSGTLDAPRRAWDAASTRAVLEHYLQQDLASIDAAYTAFVRQLTAAAAPPRRQR